MRRFVCVIGAAVIALSCAGFVSAETEEEIIERYTKKYEKKHTNKLSWISVSYQMNRINRQNDYNSFANLVSDQFSNADLPWLGQAHAFGVDLGMVFDQGFAWTIGGEYWLKQGVNESGAFNYDPPLGTATTVENFQSEITVYGVTTSLQYYIMNAPTAQQLPTSLSVRVNGLVGYYHAAWDLWPEYENLNLATATSGGTNTTFEGSAPGFQLSFGADYPLNFWNTSFTVDFGYMYLNFDNIAWYNSQDQEIIVTLDGTPDTRVDLDLSGFRGKVELKRYFTF